MIEQGEYAQAHPDDQNVYERDQSGAHLLERPNARRPAVGSVLHNFASLVE